MRLIDADALVDTLSVDPIGCAGCPEPEFMDELIDILDTAPTVKAVVITCEHCSHWIQMGDHCGDCVLNGLRHKVRTPEDGTCEYAEEDDDE